MIVQKPNNYIRKFKAGKLDNNLSYCIVEDKNIDYCCISCSVGVGSNSDPIEFQGMAHFLEHMLFLGSKKYPQENYFDKTISENGGYSNAYTSFFETNYYFKCNNNSKEKIMDIFSQFFIDPLFEESMINREINAVNSEHLKNINNDFWLKRQIIFNLSNKDSGINFFSTGNTDTLNKPRIREEMINFYEKYYCSNNIKLSIISPDHLDKTEEMIKRIFNKVPNKNCSNVKIKRGDKYNKKKMEIQLFPVNLNKECEIYYFWNIDFLDKYKLNKNIYIISDLINSIHKDSLSVYLNKNGFAYNVSTIIYEEGVFVLNVSVNKNKYDDIKDIIMEINNYIKFFFSKIKKIDVNKLYEYYHKKYNKIYQYCDKEDPIDLVQELSVNMLNYSEENYYNGDKIILEKDLDNLKKLIESFNFENINTLYYYHENLGTKNKKFDKYYKAYYSELNKSLYNDQIKDFKIEFILDNPYFDLEPKIIKDLDDKFMVPQLIKSNVFYGGVSQYNEYNIYGKLIFTSNKLFNSIENYIYLSIGISVINYYLTLQFESISDLNYSTYFLIDKTYKNISLNIHGLNDKYDLFFNNIFNYLKQIKIEENIILNTIHSYYKNLKQIDRLPPTSYYKYIIDKQLFKDLNNFNILKSLDNLMNNKENLIINIKNKISDIIIFNNTSLKIFFYGNVTKNYIENIIKKDIIKTLLEKPEIKNITTTNYIDTITVKHPNKNEDNNFVLFSFHCCKFIPKNLIMLYLIQNSMKSKVYYYLRTKNQLGYSVGSHIYEYKNNYYLFIFVQSSKKIDLIKDKMNEFIEKFKIDITKEINNKKIFKNMKEDLYKRFTEKKNNIYEKYSFYLDEIIKKRYLFNNHLILANCIKHIKIDNLINFMNKIFLNKKVITIN